MRITKTDLYDIIHAARQVGILEMQLSYQERTRMSGTNKRLIQDLKENLEWWREELDRKRKEVTEAGDLVAVHAAFMKDCITHVLGHPAESLEDCVALARICEPSILPGDAASPRGTTGRSPSTPW